MNTAKITAIGLLERDINNDVMLTWSYPGISKEVAGVLVSRCGLEEKKLSLDGDAYRWSKLGKDWQYMLSTPVDNPKQPRVKAGCVVVLSGQFNPEKFKDLLTQLTHQYLKNLDPRPLIKSYMGLFRESKIDAWFDEKYDNRRAFIASSVKGVITKFGSEACAHIWTAVLLKKRVIVYAEQVSEVLQIVRAIPLFGAWHRQDWGILRPLVSMSEAEMNDLNNAKVYIAGTLNQRWSSKPTFYDLYIDATSGKIDIAQHAKGAFISSKLHTDFGKSLVEASKKECPGYYKDRSDEDEAGSGQSQIHHSKFGLIGSEVSRFFKSEASTWHG